MSGSMRTIFITIRPDSIDGRIRSFHVNRKAAFFVTGLTLLLIIALFFSLYFTTTSYFKTLNENSAKARELKRSIAEYRTAMLNRQKDIERYSTLIERYMRLSGKLGFLLGVEEDGSGGTSVENLEKLETILSDIGLLEQRFEKIEKFSEMFDLLPIRFPLDSTFELSSAFGMRRSPITRNMEMHRGIDLSAKRGSVIMAAGSGVVQYAGRWNDIGKPNYSKLGLFVQIKHGRSAYTSLYGHCSRLLVKPGDTVKAGQPIALVGSTGWSTAPHLHFAILHNERFVDPTFYLLKFDADLFFNAVIVDNDATLLED